MQTYIQKAKAQAYKFIKAKDIFKVAKNFEKAGAKVWREDQHNNQTMNGLGYVKCIIVQLTEPQFSKVVIYVYHKPRSCQDEFLQDIQVKFFY